MSPIFPQPSRRDLLKATACGFGSLAFSAFANQTPVIAPRAKRVIFLFMQGGPSQVDTYDYKPELIKQHDREVGFYVPRSREVEQRPVMKPFWDFKQYGECGRWSSSLFPEVAKHVDDLCFIHSMHTEGVAHGPATLFLHTGATNLVRPSMGAWISYGLGAENQNLPAFVTVNPPANKGGPRNYGNAFLPAFHQGTVLGQPGNPNALPEIRNLTSPLGAESLQRERDFLHELNQLQAGEATHPLVDGAIQSHELAWRMQSHATELVDVERESRATQELYGIGGDGTDGFGRQCLAARQLAESGVRFIQVSHCDNSATPVWDQHSNMPKHEPLAQQVDRPIAGLLTDLKRRGLLEDTLVWWGAEFGRTPFSQGNNGRDHNPRGFTVWLAGGGVKPGFAYGATDEFGFQAVENKVHMHDLHATIMHLLGIDHEKLTYRYAGRDFRLTDVHGRVVKEIMA
ncbi:MAG: sulfatase [Verrucomicrobiales bacterium]|nr:sulfatase [Verrucomicrobiales bacterium]